MPGRVRRRAWRSIVVILKHRGARPRVHCTAYVPPRRRYAGMWRWPKELWGWRVPC